MQTLVERLSDRLRAKNWKLVSAESCTGGMIASAITDLAGASDVLDRGFITYSNDAKVDMLSVSQETLNEYGAVSTQVAEQMAAGALQNSNADIAVSVTGIAGPTGASEDKPLGLVFIGIATKDGCEAHHRECHGNRADIREQTVKEALTLILENI